MRSKAPSRGLWMAELVLYGIRELAEQFLGLLLDIEVDHSGRLTLSYLRNMGRLEELHKSR